ncbi:MAG: hypothetical protein FJX42_05575 [Alphaproteobacteria bacterium]|nr:hypothetical protein [Alphaproteobacteria bacterium]
MARQKTVSSTPSSPLKARSWRASSSRPIRKLQASPEQAEFGGIGGLGAGDGDFVQHHQGLGDEAPAEVKAGQIEPGLFPLLAGLAGCDCQHRLLAAGDEIAQIVQTPPVEIENPGERLVQAHDQPGFVVGRDFRQRQSVGAGDFHPLRDRPDVDRVGPRLDRDALPRRQQIEGGEGIGIRQPIGRRQRRNDDEVVADLGIGDGKDRRRVGHRDQDAPAAALRLDGQVEAVGRVNRLAMKIENPVVSVAAGNGVDPGDHIQAQHRGRFMRNLGRLPHHVAAVAAQFIQIGAGLPAEHGPHRARAAKQGQGRRFAPIEPQGNPNARPLGLRATTGAEIGCAGSSFVFTNRHRRTARHQRNRLTRAGQRGFDRARNPGRRGIAGGGVRRSPRPWRFPNFRPWRLSRPRLRRVPGCRFRFARRIRFRRRGLRRVVVSLVLGPGRGTGNGFQFGGALDERRRGQDGRTLRRRCRGRLFRCRGRLFRCRGGHGVGAQKIHHHAVAGLEMIESRIGRDGKRHHRRGPRRFRRGRQNQGRRTGRQPTQIESGRTVEEDAQRFPLAVEGIGNGTRPVEHQAGLVGVDADPHRHRHGSLDGRRNGRRPRLRRRAFFPRRSSRRRLGPAAHVEQIDDDRRAVTEGLEGEFALEREGHRLAAVAGLGIREVAIEQAQGSRVVGLDRPVE